MLSEQKAAKIISLLEELREDHPEIRDRVDKEAAAMSSPTRSIRSVKTTHEYVDFGLRCGTGATLGLVLVFTKNIVSMKTGSECSSTTPPVSRVHYDCLIISIISCLRAARLGLSSIGKQSVSSSFDEWNFSDRNALSSRRNKEDHMGFGRGVLLWPLGIPIPIIILLALFWHH
jgi:hypothetical protein